MIDKSQIEDACHELKTLRDLLRWGMSRFNEAELHFGHGTDNGWDEALQLAFHALYVPVVNQPTTFLNLIGSRLTQDERLAVLKLFQRRINERIPAAYLTETAWFAGLSFFVDERVLIPRSPMAELIEQGFSPWVEEDNIKHILDLCTGSACIAIASAMRFPDALVDAVDISPDALAVAKINVDRYQLPDQVRLLQSDLLDGLGNAALYDVIISNPPYVSAEEYADLPTEYRHEPMLGLEAGAEGLDLVTRILKDAAKHLRPEGILIVEVGNAEQALCERFPRLPFVWLDFARGGQGVFLLTREQLEDFKP